MGCRDNGPRCHTSLDHHDPNAFDISLWCRERKVRLWYVLYRAFLPLLMVPTVVFAISISQFPAKWPIYLTCQGLTLLILNYTLQASLVANRWFWERKNPGLPYHIQPRLTRVYKVLWVLGTVSFDLALLITIMYWTFLYQGDEGTLDLILDIFVHGFNTATCLLDSLVTKRPYRFGHVLFTIAYGFCYMAFSLVYWAAGGLGQCVPYDADQMVEADVDSYVVVSDETSGDRYRCPKYIYPILDWNSHPEVGVATALACTVLILAAHLFWMGLDSLKGRYFVESKLLQNESMAEA